MVAGLLNSLSQCASKELGGTKAAVQSNLGDTYSEAYYCSTLSKDGIFYLNSLHVQLQVIL